MFEKNYSFKKRRGVSQIIGTLVVLALVASVGSVILFQGLNQINAFNHDLTFHDKAHNDALREDILFEHASFDPASKELTLYLANIGTIDSTVSTVKVVKIDSQELIISQDDLNETILLESHINFNTTASLIQGNQTWADDVYYGKDYKISVATSKG
ncbi:MAG: hypothetical protein OEQ12_07650, partial [Nitrosopumilus sp.]|nr:hypothetical protein [Nitrosopumilus sp.]